MKIKNYEVSIWDIISFLAFLWVMTYYILKALNIFHSPLIADIISILSIGFISGRYITKLNLDISTLKTDVSILKSDVSELKEEVSELKSDMTLVKRDINKLNKKVFDA